MNSNLKTISNVKHNFFNKKVNMDLNSNLSKEIKKPIQSTGRRFAKFPIDAKEINKEYVINILRKTPGIRTVNEINIISEYLSQNYQYFSQLKQEHDELVIEKISKISRVELVKEGKTIIRYGEIGDKFYFVLEGIVEIFKPKFIEKNETPLYFLKLLKKIKDEEGDENKYKRIKDKNINFFKSITEEINNSNNFQNRTGKQEYKQLFKIEIEEKLGEYGEGFSFGDIALIKKSPRNATIKAKDDCILLSINHNDYNRTIEDFQKRKLIKEIDDFIKTYPFFRNFDNDKIVKLFNCFTKIELYRDDFLYKQNMNANSIYVLISGSFKVYSCISFPWINDYINYMDYSEKNILNVLIENKNVKIEDLIKFFQDLQEKNKTLHTDKEKIGEWFRINESQKNDNLFNLKKDEEKLNSSEYLFQLNLKKVDYKDVLGIEEAFEFKKRLCNYKCISDKAELKEINLMDLMRLIINMNKNEISDILNIIQERKKILKSQIINSLKNIDKEIILNFDSRYENLVNSKKYKNKEDVLFSSLKVKGYKTSIQDLLDKKVILFPFDNDYTSKEILKKIKRKNKSTEELLNNFYKQKINVNDFKFNKKKNNIRLIKNQIESRNCLINNYHNITPNIRISKTIEHNFLSPQNSNRFRKNKILPLNINSRSYFNAINYETQNFKGIKSNYLNINTNTKTKSRIFPILMNDKITKNKISNKINNKFDRSNRENYRNIKESFLNKEKDYKGLFNTFDHLDKNFYLGENFMIKLKKNI